MKRIMNAKVCVPLILILIGITFYAAHGTWSWAGAWSWCQKYDDGWGIASGNVGWGGIKSGTWSTTAKIDGSSGTNSGTISDIGIPPQPPKCNRETKNVCCLSLIFPVLHLNR